MTFNKALIAVVFAAATLPSAGAFAAASSMTDAQYLALARCDGLASSKALGVADVSTLAGMFKAQGAGRTPAVSDRADEARSDAVRQAGHAGATGKLGLIAERDGACQAWARGAGAASASNSVPKSALN